VGDAVETVGDSLGLGDGAGVGNIWASDAVRILVVGNAVETNSNSLGLGEVSCLAKILYCLCCFGLSDR